jgi:hypothetical protein
MARNLSRLSAYRRPSMVSGLLLGVAVALSSIVTRLPGSSDAFSRGARGWLLPLSLVAALLLLVAAVTVAVHVSLTPKFSSVTDEEPLLARPRLPIVRRDVPFVVVLGLHAKAGATSLISNLAVVVATEGRIGPEAGRRPRPVCLLKSRTTGDGVPLDPMRLDHYLLEHPTGTRDDLIELATWHPSGAEFFSTAQRLPHASQLRHMLPMLRRYYDAILFDGSSDDRWLMDAAAELADAVLLVGQPSAARNGLVGQWSERIWGLGFEGKTILVLNRRRATDRSESLRHPFYYTWELSDDPAVRDSERTGTAWGIGNSSAARQLRIGARALLPTLFAGAPG